MLLAPVDLEMDVGSGSMTAEIVKAVIIMIMIMMMLYLSRIVDLSFENG